MQKVSDWKNRGMVCRKHTIFVIIHRRGRGERGENKYNGRLHNFLFLSPKNLQAGSGCKP